MKRIILSLFLLCLILPSIYAGAQEFCVSGSACPGYAASETSAAGYGIVNGAQIDTWGTKVSPTGTVVGTTDTQTLTNKTLSGYAPSASPIFTGPFTVHDATDATKTWSPDTANMPTGMKYKNQIVYPIFSDTSGLTTQFAASGTAVTGSNPLTLPLAKTWHIWGTVQTSLVSFTQTALNQATCYLYTSNGSAAIADTTAVVMIPIGASITFAGPTIYLPPTDYTTSATTDQISVYCSSSLSTSSQLLINATSIRAR